MTDVTVSKALTPVLQPTTFAELIQFARLAADSDLMPKDYKGKPPNIMIAIQMGSELGLSPMQAIQNIAVINGRPSVWGDAMLGLVKQSPFCEDVIESFEGEGDALKAVCIAKRRGKAPVVRTFSVADAKQAKLFTKPGPWQEYPRRMLAMRARGFALRDAFPDVLRGLITAEEARDMPTIEGRAEPVPAARQAPRQAAQQQPRQESPPPAGNGAQAPAESPASGASGTPAPAAPPAGNGAPAAGPRAEWQRPEYPIELPNGQTIIMHSGTDFMAEWAAGIERVGDNMTMLRKARDANKQALAVVRDFDPLAAGEVETMIARALGEQQGAAS